MANDKRSSGGGNLQSVNRALRALELIAEERELGVTELGRRLGVHKATASRLVATLAERGLVERDPLTEKYRLGFGLIRLAGAAMASLDLVRTGRPILEELADKTRETVNLGVLSGDMTLPLASGPHKITLSRDGVNPVTAEVPIPQGEKKTWTPPAPEIHTDVPPANRP